MVMANVTRSIFMPIVISMEVTAALMSQFEMENAMKSTILPHVKIMMEVIVDHQILPIGQDVPIILL